MAYTTCIIEVAWRIESQVLACEVGLVQEFVRLGGVLALIKEGNVNYLFSRYLRSNSNTLVDSLDSNFELNILLILRIIFKKTDGMESNIFNVSDLIFSRKFLALADKTLGIRFIKSQSVKVMNVI